MKKHVALIFGGEGYERRISEKSAENLASIIDESLYDILYVGITEYGAWYIYNGSKDKIKNGSWHLDESLLIPTYPVKLGKDSGFITKDGIIAVCCAIPCLHGDFGEDGIIQGALSCAHISYIGQDVYASAVTSDKIYTKLISEHLEIPTAKWIFEVSDDPKAAKSRAEIKLNYPMFLKPSRLGSSYGANPVYRSENFEVAYAEAKKYGDSILIEELVPFEYELECALFDNGKRRFSPGGRVISDGKFYDYNSKYDKVLSPITEAYSGKDSDIEARITEYSQRVADFIGLKHLARIDFFITENKEIYFNEINVFPGMTSTSLYPKLTEDMGLEKGSFINLLIKEVCSDDRRI